MEDLVGNRGFADVEGTGGRLDDEIRKTVVDESNLVGVAGSLGDEGIALSDLPVCAADDAIAAVHRDVIAEDANAAVLREVADNVGAAVHREVIADNADAADPAEEKRVAIRRGKRAACASGGLSLVRRCARTGAHPLEGSIFIPAILNSFSSEKIFNTVKLSGIILTNGEDDVSDFKDKELERIFSLP